MMEGYEKNRYDKSAVSLYPTVLTIFVEGEANKKFYSSFKKFENQNCNVRVGNEINNKGNSCNNIINIINDISSKNCIGIIDGDFNDSEIHNKIFKIDFYSIENIVVIYHKLFHELFTILKEEFLPPFFSNHKIIRKSIQAKTTNRNQNFDLEFEKDDIDNQYHEYIDKKINNEDDYIRYMNLKKVVDKFSIYKINCRNTNKEDKKIYRKYIETLFNYMNDSHISEIFSNSEYKRINKFLQNFNKMK